MALVPKINICINNKCDKIDVYEETGPYSLTNNPEGWSNSGTTPGHLDTSEIITAYLNIYDYLGNTLNTSITLKDPIIDVYVGVTGAPAPASFLAVQNVTWSQPDGIYKLVYTITDGSSTIYTNETQHKLFTCNLENCLASLKNKAITECSSDKLSKIKDKINQLEILIYGIQSAFSCADWEKAINLIASGTVICENLCDCGCGDC